MSISALHEWSKSANKKDYGVKSSVADSDSLILNPCFFSLQILIKALQNSDPGQEGSLKPSRKLYASVSDPDWTHIQTGQWIRIRTENPYPGRSILSPKKENNEEISCLKSSPPGA
jgi:hypothetical protein